MSVRDEVVAVLAEHPPTETEHGPLYCRPCSEVIRDWVQWTPEHVADALLASPAFARLLDAARGGVQIRDGAADDFRDYATAIGDSTGVGDPVPPARPSEEAADVADLCGETEGRGRDGDGRSSQS